MKTYWILILWLVCGSSVKAQTSVIGILVKEITGEPVPFILVSFYQNDIFKLSLESDKKGRFSVINLEGGYYDLEILGLIHQSYSIKNFFIKENRINTFYFGLEDFQGCGIMAIEYQIPLIDYDLTTSGIHISFKNKTPNIH